MVNFISGKTVNFIYHLYYLVGLVVKMSVSIKISDLAGAWMMSDKETEGFMSDLKEGWKKWNEVSITSP